jgi:hypothetical protein
MRDMNPSESLRCPTLRKQNRAQHDLSRNSEILGLKLLKTPIGESAATPKTLSGNPIMGLTLGGFT